MKNDSSPKKLTVAYAPFKTFLSAIQTLEHGVPDTIDRTVWPSFSGVIQSQILGTLRFLGLIQPDGTTTPELKKFVADESARKEMLRKFLERSYPEIMKKDPAKMSMGAFETAMREYGVTGTTHQKAISFFLQAARFSDLPLSHHILSQTRAVSNRKRKGPVLRTKPEETITPSNGGPPATFSGPTKTITLQRGITLTLQTSKDAFQMDPEDRGFVLKLLAQVEEYEGQKTAKPENEVS
jgi:hypothetical protein